MHFNPEISKSTFAKAPNDSPSIHRSLQMVKDLEQTHSSCFFKDLVTSKYTFKEDPA